jgi:hypothetical protein
MASWFVRITNGIETHDLEQPDRATAEETARLCRLAVPSPQPSVMVMVICIPGRDDSE